MKHYVNQTPAYDVSGGSTNFDKVSFLGSRFLSVQIFYTSISVSDAKIRLQESLDGVNFVDSKDESGNTIEMVLNNALTNDILCVVDFNTAFFRLQYIEGTAATGSIDSLKMMFE